MIRRATHDDSATVTALAVAAGLFPASDTSVTDQMMADYFARNRALGHGCVIDEEAEPLGVAYYAPATATDGTWYLTMIAVRPDAQGRGRGAALMRHVEEALRASGQRVLLVETSGHPSFARTRAFYAKQGYEEEARIREYYAAGEDMVLFRKALGAAATVAHANR